jgi:hypothetical protein
VDGVALCLCGYVGSRSHVLGGHVSPAQATDIYLYQNPTFVELTKVRMQFRFSLIDAMLTPLQ